MLVGPKVSLLHNTGFMHVFLSLDILCAYKASILPHTHTEQACCALSKGHLIIVRIRSLVMSIWLGDMQ